MNEEWRIKGELLQEVDALRSRIAELEQTAGTKTNGVVKGPEQALRTILDDVTEGILLADVEEKKFFTGNRAICQMLGWKREEIQNLTVADIYLQEDLDRVMEQYEKHRNGELAVVRHMPIRKEDGSILWADIVSIPFTHAGRTHVMSVFRESSRRKAKARPQGTSPADSLASRHLTATEIRVLRLIIDGMTSAEVAKVLHRSTKTIEHHRAHLMKKLGVDNSVELVKRAVEMGLVDLPTGQRQDETT